MHSVICWRLSLYACVLYLAHTLVHPGTAGTASLLDEATPKKVLSAHGSRNPDKSWCEVKAPENTQCGHWQRRFPWRDCCSRAALLSFLYIA